MKVNCIMVVEDSEADQFLCKIAIEKYNPDVTILQAYDGQQAAEILASSAVDPDLILLDINMPRMDGYEFLEKNHEFLSEKNIHVVMLTSSNNKKDESRVSEFSCIRRYIQKPVSFEMLQKLDF